jgi:hypothetical protein
MHLKTSKYACKYALKNAKICIKNIKICTKKPKLLTKLNQNMSVLNFRSFEIGELKKCSEELNLSVFKIKAFLYQPLIAK